MAVLRSSDLVAVNDELRRIGYLGLLLLIGCTFCLDIFHGIRLGQDQVAFDPIYRLRQSLAVAISRLHEPSPGGYLAYKSVVDVLDQNGFAQFDDEPGPHLDKQGRDALFNNGPLLDRIIHEAREVAIDRALPSDIIRANELGFADYIYVSFRLFGDRLSSLYYFYFLIAAATCLLYVVQFCRSPISLFVLVIFLAELYFLENYVHSYGTYLNTVTNSRLYSGLSLVPALHVLLVLWRRPPLHAFTVAAVVMQSLIFAFLLSCRTEVAWQLVLIAAIACGMGLFALASRGQGLRVALRRFGALWPAAVFVAVVSAYSAAVSASADQRYAMEPKAHIVWHEVLMGILSTSPELRRQYVGDDLRTYGDPEVYTAVIRDINARNDASSPIVRRDENGKLNFDLMKGWSEYEKLVRSLTLRIILHHPLAVLAAIPTKIGDQIMLYDPPYAHSMAWDNLRVFVMIVAVGALLCIAAGGLTVDRPTLRGTAFIIAVILIFAAMTPMIHPSPLSIGTLFCYLGVIAISISYAAALAIRALARIKATTAGD